MVKVRAEQPLHSDGSVDIEFWLTKLSEKNPAFNLARIRSVCDLSQQAEERAVAAGGVWAVGQSSFRTGLDMADILSELFMDEDGLVAALIYRAVRENQITLNHVRKNFGNEVAHLVQGVLRMAAISNIKLGVNQTVLGEQSDQLEQAKRMLIALVDDVRVVLVKLAERTCAIRNIAKSSAKKRERLAREVMEIYAPLAHRLGIGHLKWELEDIAFRYLEPLDYKRIAKQLDEKREDRNEHIEFLIQTLETKLKKISVSADVYGRAKHIYSIWRKMKKKGIPFSEVYDVRAIRILVGSVSECYSVLGVVHNSWRNVPNEFDDYIAIPKENGYRSLHTAVIGPAGKPLEIQIRTHEMHEEAEYGVCSHWQYKGNEDSDEPQAYDRRISWLRQFMDWQEDTNSLKELTDELINEVSLDRIYVFTPEGQVIDMMPGATPIDFAYRVHTEVGHTCRGAKINSRVVPLNYKLNSGDQIEIITGTEVEPRREWLHEHLGYVATSRARAKIQTWFGNRTKLKNIDEGKHLLSSELKHLGIEHLDADMFLQFVEYDKVEDMYAAIGAGDMSPLDVVEAAADLLGLGSAKAQLKFSFKESKQDKLPSVVFGVGDFEHIICACCSPVPGDSIMGMIDDDHLVHVHSQGCIKVLAADKAGRIMRLDWQKDVQQTFPIGLEVDAYDRPGLLHDITGVFFKEGTNVVAMSSAADRKTQKVAVKMTMEVTGLDELLRIMEKIEQLPNVISARRNTAY